VTTQPFHFQLHATEGRARAGTFHTPHGEIQTPAFAPVGTQASVKAITPSQLNELGANLVLANTYHLYLRPGDELVAELGGLHNFMSWSGPMLTDSGGFQVFSLANSRAIDDDGVTFRSHIDGSTHRFTPEKAIAIQENLGADIIMAFDECAQPYNRSYNQQAVKRTHAWAERCLAAKSRDDQALFGIVQGGVFPDLRQNSAAFITSLDFPGNAIGGLSVGETKEEMHAMLEVVDPILPEDKPRYLMGVGSPEDIVEAVAGGIDIFDSALPTRVARNGALYTHTGRINIDNSSYKKAAEPLDVGCTCYTCKNFSAAYLHHLFSSGELLALRLATIHNLSFISSLMRDIREAIIDNTFTSFKEDFLKNYQPTDEEVRIEQKKKWLKVRNTDSTD
jgi:queuine tRNA-ribosyltransferase